MNTNIQRTDTGRGYHLGAIAMRTGGGIVLQPVLDETCSDVRNAQYILYC